MISQTAEYALRAVVFLGEQTDDARHPIQEIAAATKVPPGYLAKVMQGLVRAGLVRSQRGIGGGFALALAPERLTVYDVVQAVDPIERIRECPLGRPEHRDLCSLHRRLDDAAAQVERSFRDTTVAELTARPLCRERTAKARKAGAAKPRRRR